MEKKVLRQEITVLIDNIKEHSDKITPLERVNQLELEMILSKIKKLYEKSIVFNYLNEVDRHNNLGEKKKFLQVENVISHNEDLNLKTSAAHSNIETKDSLHNSHEMNQSNPVLSVNAIENNQITEPAKEILNKDSEDKTTNENLVSEDIIEQKTPQTSPNYSSDDLSKPIVSSNLSSSFSKKPIDLSIKSIGINERFIFIKELFKNDAEKLNEVINQVNELNSFAEADAFLKTQVANNYNWNYKSTAVLNFMKLVEKRFS